MSYDFDLFVATSGVDPLSSFYLQQEERDQGLSSSCTDSDKHVHALKDTLISALLLISPDLHIHTSEPTNCLEQQFIELTNLDHGTQISLFDDCASISVPYNHSQNDSQGVFQIVWKYLQTFKDAAELFVFDPQLEQVLKLETDFPMVLHSYNTALEQINHSIRKKTR